jgi:hypothetical protein
MGYDPIQIRKIYPEFRLARQVVWASLSNSDGFSSSRPLIPTSAKSIPPMEIHCTYF